MGFYLKFVLFTALFCITAFLFRYYALLLVVILLVLPAAQPSVSDQTMKRLLANASYLMIVSAGTSAACFLFLIRYADADVLRTVFEFFSSTSFASGSWEYELANIETRKPRKETNFLPLTPEAIRLSYAYYATYIFGSFASSIVFAYILSHGSQFVTIVDKILMPTMETRVLIWFVMLYSMTILHIGYFPSFELHVETQLMNLFVVVFCWPFCASMALFAAQVTRSIIRR